MQKYLAGSGGMLPRGEFEIEVLGNALDLQHFGNYNYALDKETRK